MSIDRFLLPLRKLQGDGVRFVVVGGLAVVLHGHMRLTMDLDLAVSLDDENVKRLVKSLSELGYQPRIPVDLQDFSDPKIRNEWIRDKNMKALNLWRSPDPFSALDILIETPLPFEVLYSDAESLLLEEIPVKVVSIPHLIEMKAAAGRETDKSDILALEALKKVIDEKD